MFNKHSRSAFPRTIPLQLIALALIGFSLFGFKRTTSHSEAQAPRATRAANTLAAVAIPDPQLTPGEIDPRVTQDNIDTTICKYGYTHTVRPPLEITNKLKHHVMNLYHSPGSFHDYELDHLIALELGGCPHCIKNLWPQPWTSPGAHEKDEVENYLHDRVCHKLMSLSDAQQIITMNWYSVYLAMNPLEQRK